MFGFGRAWLVFAIMGLVGCVEGRRSDPRAEGPGGVFRPATQMDVSATEDGNKDLDYAATLTLLEKWAGIQVKGKAA